MERHYVINGLHSGNVLLELDPLVLQNLDGHVVDIVFDKVKHTLD
jgi:hypothetical protein